MSQTLLGRDGCNQTRANLTICRLDRAKSIAQRNACFYMCLPVNIRHDNGTVSGLPSSGGRGCVWKCSIGERASGMVRAFSRPPRDLPIAVMHSFDLGTPISSHSHSLGEPPKYLKPQALRGIESIKGIWKGV